LLPGDTLLSLSRLFAGDTSIGYASQDEDQIKYVINHDLHELGNVIPKCLWSDVSGINFPSK
jgi:hypothetical protein